MAIAAQRCNIRGMGVRLRLLLGTLAVVVVTTLGLGTLLIRMERDNDRSVATVRLLEAIETLSIAIASDLGHGNVNDARALAQRVVQSSDLSVDEVMLISPDGYDLVGQHAVDVNEPSLQRVLQGEKVELWPPPPSLPVRVTYGIDAVGLRYALTMSIAERSLQSTLSDRWRLWLLGLLVSGLAASVFWLGVEVEVLRPLRSLKRMAEDMRAGTLGARAPLVGGREFRNLSATLNDAAIRLQNQQTVLENAVRERTAALTAANHALSDLARTDALTGLHNRRAFDELLAQESGRQARHRSPFAIAMIDVDNFKFYNDTHGHPQGDVLLRALAAVLRTHVRSTDIVARFGGEEFAVLLLGTSPDDAVVTANKLRKGVAEASLPFGEQQPLGCLSVSVGVAAAPDHGQTPEAVLLAADMALYAAKHAGRNQVQLAPRSPLAERT
jgi:diguanylate cyclase (GGDEF)-like protein